MAPKEKRFSSQEKPPPPADGDRKGSVRGSVRVRGSIALQALSLAPTEEEIKAGLEAEEKDKKVEKAVVQVAKEVAKEPAKRTESVARVPERLVVLGGFSNSKVNGTYIERNSDEYVIGSCSTFWSESKETFIFCRKGDKRWLVSYCTEFESARKGGLFSILSRSPQSIDVGDSKLIKGWESWSGREWKPVPEAGVVKVALAGDQKEVAQVTASEDTAAAMTPEERREQAKRFLKQLWARVLMIGFVVCFFSAGAGMLFQGAASQLVQDAGHFEQVWQERIELKTDDDLMNKTYIKIYDKMHRDDTVEPSAPKMQDRWVYAYYIRMSLIANLGYALPWFFLFTTIGWARTRRYFLLFFAPQAVFMFAYGFLAAAYLCGTGRLLLDDWPERIGGFVLAGLQTFVAIPYVQRKVGLKHAFRPIIMPYLILWVALVGLRYFVPVMTAMLTIEWNKVLFRLTLYQMGSEFLVGLTRLSLRFVPLEDQEEVRPEDKPLILLGIMCLFQYWGRIIMMDLKEPGPQIVCSFGLGMIEFFSRITVVSRDKAYMRVVLRSKLRMSAYWSGNAAGMKRFRCSTIYMHGVLEYLMIFSAFSFSYASGLTRAIDLASLSMNLCIQIGSELIVDALSFYWELFREKLPIVAAWDARKPNWAWYFGIFVVCFNLFAISQTGEYFCAFENPDLKDAVVLRYCGREK